MERITDTITYPLYTSRAFDLYFSGLKLGVLDIETTGLNPERSCFVLGGLLTIKEGNLCVQQFFAEEPEQERAALEAYLKAVAQTDFLLTYNGHRFDIPYIKRRAGRSSSDLPFNLDLYLLIKNYSPIRKFLPNLKQKTVESFMGLWDYRKDEISGADSVDLYYQYVTWKDPVVREKILLHNRDDVLQLYRLLAVLEKADVHRAMFHMGFPLLSSSRQTSLTVEKISASGHYLQISGKQCRNPVDYQCFQWENIPCHVRFVGRERWFSVSVPLIRQGGLALVDMEALKMDLSVFEKYPACQEGFLIFEQEGQKNYLEINFFVKLLLERILNQWIIRP